ncbi:hypothetical protein Cantr_06487 [Candida viswanathii]|uniref:Enoyl reductase (ER) domain-containing protein n=1 Tax=Candida viswanathii TaxID=5486 RepID=A0A367XXH2_9ASCO|nr:hypothetical protein Cantr_06487 [Candida viswanathii]
MTTKTLTEEPSRKRFKTNKSEIIFKEAYLEESTTTSSSSSSDQPPRQIKFTQKHQSILLITHLKDPLKVQTEYPIPDLQPHEILVHNRAIGLNPIDWKGKKYGFGIYHFPWINGRESSGDIVKLGEQVDTSSYAVGHKVIISSTSYRDNRTSTFQQYTAIDSRLVWKLPESFSYEDGATIGVGLVTAGVILYNSFGFELAEKPEQINGTILIWGGATVVGLYLSQLAKIYGLKVIAIASTKHEEYLRKLGVDYLIDRHLSEDEIIEKIDEIEEVESIEYGVDCVSKETSKTVLRILDHKLKKEEKEKDEEEDVKNTQVKPKFSGIVGIPKEYPETVDVRDVVIKRFHEDVSYGRKFIEITNKFLNTRQVEPVRFKQYKGGLHIIDDALKDLEKIGANGEKYVVSV